jgi:5'-3' exonuclease
MIALIDIDSIFYLSSYRLDDPVYIEKWGLSSYDDEIILDILADTAINRTEKILDDIFLNIENEGIFLTSKEIYLTYCKNSVRKKIYPNYKANRKKNLLVNKIRQKYTKIPDVIFDDEYEADDLIADRARSLNIDDYIIITMDKDLQQIGGLIYNFYRKPSKKDEFGNITEIFEQKGLSYNSNFEGLKFLAKQIIIGDSGDNIKGLHNYGKIKANKIIEPIENLFGLKKAVINEYKNVFGKKYKEELKTNFRLVYLGKY